jgi:hypothetical protein
MPQQRRPTRSAAIKVVPLPRKRVQHDVAPRRAVQDGVRHQRHRLHRRVQAEQVALLGGAPEGVHPGVAPQVGAVPAVLAQLDVVAVRARPALNTSTSSCWLRYSEPMPALSLAQTHRFFSSV